MEAHEWGKDIFQPSSSLKEIGMRMKGFSSHKRKEHSISTHDYKPRAFVQEDEERNL